MKRKEYLKPSMLMVTMVQRKCLLTGSVDPKKGDAAMKNYERRDTQNW